MTKYNDWVDDKNGRLALVILGYFICRIVHENTADMYKFDELTSMVARQVMQNEVNKMSYDIAERLILIFPLMSNESLMDARLAVNCL